jgi:hypothetical protein
MFFSSAVPSEDVSRGFVAKPNYIRQQASWQPVIDRNLGIQQVLRPSEGE